MSMAITTPMLDMSRVQYTSDYELKPNYMLIYFSTYLFVSLSSLHDLWRTCSDQADLHVKCEDRVSKLSVMGDKFGGRNHLPKRIGSTTI